MRQDVIDYLQNQNLGSFVTATELPGMKLEKIYILKILKRFM